MILRYLIESSQFWCNKTSFLLQTPKNHLVLWSCTTSPDKSCAPSPASSSTLATSTRTSAFLVAMANIKEGLRGSRLVSYSGLKTSWWNWHVKICHKTCFLNKGWNHCTKWLEGLSWGSWFYFQWWLPYQARRRGWRRAGWRDWRHGCSSPRKYY